MLLKIWTEPKLTLAHILNNCPDKHVAHLLVLGGIAKTIHIFHSKDMGDKMPVTILLIAAVIIGLILGSIVYPIKA